MVFAGPMERLGYNSSAFSPDVSRQTTQMFREQRQVVWYRRVTKESGTASFFWTYVCRYYLPNNLCSAAARRYCLFLLSTPTT